MPFIDANGVHCGMTDCRHNQGLSVLRCKKEYLPGILVDVPPNRGTYIKDCPIFEKGEDGYTSEW